MKTNGFLIRLLHFVALTLASSVFAVDPPPGGGYPNENTALGEDALFHLPPDATGQNTALGFQAMYNNTNGSQNVAVGDAALFSNTLGSGEIAVGYLALHANTTGDGNVAIGAVALSTNTTGFSNIAVGTDALLSNTTGNYNTAIGDSALGFSTTGSYNNALGQLGVRSSSARFKEAVKPMGAQSEAILSLRPVSFRYKKELDPCGDAQFGLVAEDVAKIAPELVVRDEQDNPLSVRYEEVNAMLLNEFLKEHKKVEQ